MSKFLQNHIGFKDFPIKHYFNFQDLKTVRSPFRKLFNTLSVLVFVLLFFAGISLYFIETGPDAQINPKFWAIVAFILAGILFIYYLWEVNRASNIARTQQYKYYEWGNINAPTQQQKEALQLCAFRTMNVFYWPETLEFEPCERRVKHIKKYEKKLDTLGLRKKEYFKESINADWGIVTKKDLDYHVNELFRAGHSYGFALDAVGPDKDHMKQRLLDLTELPEKYYDQCIRRDGKNPPKLIWAWDLWRIIWMARTAFAGEIIDEEHAWSYIYKASDRAHAIFDSIDDFHNNLILGSAFWSGNLSRVNEMKQETKMLKDLKWPIYKTAWTKRAMELPDFVATGFQREIDQFLNPSEENHNPIGFRTAENQQDKEE